MNTADLYLRRSTLQREAEDLTDSISDISNRIEQAGETLRAAKSSYLIEPGAGQKVTELKSAQATFDRLISEESTAIRERNDIENALATIEQRIGIAQAQEEKQKKDNISALVDVEFPKAQTEFQHSLAKLAVLRSSGKGIPLYRQDYAQMARELTDGINREKLGSESN